MKFDDIFNFLSNILAGLFSGVIVALAITLGNTQMTFMWQSLIIIVSLAVVVCVGLLLLAMFRKSSLQ